MDEATQCIYRGGKGAHLGRVILMLLALYMASLSLDAGE